jgi:hypothetical protein
MPQTGSIGINMSATGPAVFDLKEIAHDLGADRPRAYQASWLGKALVHPSPMLTGFLMSALVLKVRAVRQTARIQYTNVWLHLC